MRLWSLHPKYLDAAGLVALWREALLAQAVLCGKTVGYRHHPQLIRFRACARPEAAIAQYLHVVHSEAAVRGYNFDKTKIPPGRTATRITVKSGQVNYEWQHLRKKLRSRAPEWLTRLKSAGEIDLHPLFRVVRGPIEEVEEWEIISR